MPDFGFDDWIDAQLRSVPLPADLHARLVESNRPPNAEDKLDLAIRNVPVPDSLRQKLLSIARGGRTPATWIRVAIAASLLLAAGIVFGLANWATQQPLAPAQVARQSPATIEPSPRPTATGVPGRLRQAPRPAPIRGVRGSDEEDRQDVQDPIADQAPPDESPRLALTALGAPAHAETMPELEIFERPSPRGVAPPRVLGYDLLFHLKHGEHPFVSPAQPELASSQAPFTFRTSSYDEALRRMRVGEALASDEIRVEDFLAAVDDQLPPAAGNGLALHVAASRSPFGDDQPHLVQLMVRAPLAAATPHAPTRLIVLVERSSRMHAAGRWPVVERSLAKLATSMRDTDRVTLVGYGEQAESWLADANARQLGQHLSGGLTPAPAESTSFLAAVQAAEAAARANPGPARQVVLFLTSGREALDERSRELAARQLERLSGDGVAWEVLRVDAAASGHDLSDLAERAGGKIGNAADASQLFHTLWEHLTAQTSRAASAASLKLTFNPKVVGGYRLLGHESATLTAPPSDPLSIDFHLGDTTTVLYEVWIRPQATESAMTAELTWRDPRNGQPRQAARVLNRPQLGGRYAAAPAWFQQSVIAAKTAESLKGSFYAPAAQPFSQIAQLTAQVDPRLLAEGELAQLLKLVEQHQKARH